MTPEQEGGEGVARVRDWTVEVRMAEDFYPAFKALLGASPELCIFRAQRLGPAPSPHEGEAARCPGCDGPPGPSPMAECIDPFHNRPAPTEPRSISEEQLERVRRFQIDALRGDEGHLSDPDLYLPLQDAVGALLSAYEQEKARADEAEARLKPDADYSPEYQDEYQRLWHKTAAERDAPKALGALMREALERAASLLDTLGTVGHPSIPKRAKEARQEARRLRALTSTPDPEERAGGLRKRTPEERKAYHDGFYAALDSVHKHGLEWSCGTLRLMIESDADSPITDKAGAIRSIEALRDPAPDPTPEPEEGRG